MPRQIRVDLLRDIAWWPLALEGVAARQTRLPHDCNNDAPDEDGDENQPLMPRKSRGNRGINLASPCDNEGWEFASH